MNAVANRLMVVAVLLMASGVCYGQGLERGNLIGVHVITVNLKPGVSMEDFTKFYVEHVLPEYEKNWPGLEGYLLKSFFSDSKNKFAVVWLFKTVEYRNRNFNPDGTSNELERAAHARVEPIEDKLKEMYGSYTVQYTHEDDWVVQ
jgi:hypothetical protein